MESPKVQKVCHCLSKCCDEKKIIHLPGFQPAKFQVCQDAFQWPPPPAQGSPGYGQPFGRPVRRAESWILRSRIQLLPISRKKNTWRVFFQLVNHELHKNCQLQNQTNTVLGSFQKNCTLQKSNIDIKQLPFFERVTFSKPIILCIRPLVFGEGTLSSSLVPALNDYTPQVQIRQREAMKTSFL